METRSKRQRVADEVRATIARAGIKPAILADEIGMARSTMSRKLSGKASLTVDDLLKIADALSLEPGDMFPARSAA